MLVITRRHQQMCEDVLTLPAMRAGSVNHFYCACLVASIPTSAAPITALLAWTSFIHPESAPPQLFAIESLDGRDGL